METCQIHQSADLGQLHNVYNIKEEHHLLVYHQPAVRSNNSRWCYEETRRHTAHSGNHYTALFLFTNSFCIWIMICFAFAMRTQSPPPQHTFLDKDLSLILLARQISPSFPLLIIMVTGFLCYCCWLLRSIELPETQPLVSHFHVPLRNYTPVHFPQTDRLGRVSVSLTADAFGIL